MRLIFFPITLKLLFLFIYKYPISVCMIIHPFSLIHISICFGKLSVAPSTIFFPLSLIFGVVRPYLYSDSLSEIVDDLTIINGPIFKPDYFSPTDLRRWVLIDSIYSLKSRHLIYFLLFFRGSNRFNQFLGSDILIWSLLESFVMAIGQNIVAGIVFR